MSRGRKRRVSQCQPPPKGHYTVDWVINDLLSLNALSGPALSLWLHLKGLAWERGECDPTDERLAELLGGVTVEMVRITRRELRNLHLLLEYQKPGAPAVRWLIPLPMQSGLRGSLPAEIGEGVALAEMQLKQMLAQLRTARSSHPDGNLPQVEFGANSICPKLPLKEEEDLPPPPELINTRARVDNARGNGEEGVGGGGIYPKQNLGQIELGPNSAWGEMAADADMPAERAALCEFLAARGVFPAVAGGLAADLLGRMAPAEARAYALAHLWAVRAGGNGHGRPLSDEQAIGRWVARLRQRAEPPAWALAQVQQELACDAVAASAAGDDEDAAAEDDESAAPEDGEDGEPTPPAESCAQESAAEAAALWQTALAHLQYQIPRSVYTANLIGSRGLGLEQAADGVPTLVVQVTGAPAAAWLNMHFKPMILRTLHSLAGREYAVRFVTEEHV